MPSNLAANFPIISDQIKRPALEVVLANLEKVLRTGVEGDVVEFGCYIGTTSLFIRRLLDAHGQSDTRQFHVYDSFEGLPPKSPQDNSPVGADFKAGELSVSKKQLQVEFARARLRAPIVHKGWFGKLQGGDVPQHIAFAFLDGDFYGSIFDSLKLVWPRMAAGGIICFDDYKRDALPGVERAVHDYFQGKPPEVRVAHNIGVLRVPG
ncbi:MAG TPA: TylF/MycF/NovP-related O-methyltransferase [Candidatus Saccharimonadales bacterium]|jgi:O-methyltransferase